MATEPLIVFDKSFEKGHVRGEGVVTFGYEESMLRGEAKKTVAPSESGAAITMGGFAKYSFLNASGKIGVGNEDFSVSLKGVGDVLVGQAQAGLAVSNGLGATIGGRGSALSWRATVEIQIKGTEIELGMTGDCISFGAQASVGVFEDGFFEKSSRASFGPGRGYVARVKPGWN